jgi:squalene-hopene/tetraprenyl-beta-curcumene cyclase
MFRHTLLLLLSLLCLGPVQGAEPAPAKVHPKTATKATAAVTKGATFLISTQNADGSWGKYPHPAIAALAAMAIHQAPGVEPAKSKASVDLALKYVLSFVQEDGAIYPYDRNMKSSANYPNYTTSISLMALAAIGRPEDIPVMQAARKYMQARQFTDPQSVDYGGVGYAKTGRADLSNASWAAEALYFTENLDREPFNQDPEAPKRNAAMWNNLQTFLSKCQNLPETNSQPYVSKDPKDRGGFFYRPFESEAGSRDGEDATTSLVSTGSMTYAGLKSMIYARMDLRDQRVKGAMDFLAKNYTLAENPGMGQGAYFYYLHIMTKALEAYGREVLTDAKGVPHLWRMEVLNALLTRQHEDGSWTNPDGRYMESLADLVTSYSLITARIALGNFSLKYHQ